MPMTQEQRTKVLVNKSLKLSIHDADKWVSKLTDNDKQELERTACSVAVNLAVWSEYLSFRGAAGCGDHGHAAAIKAADKMQKRARKVLGYAFP